MNKSDFVDYVVHDLLSELAGVKAQAMFGGWGIYQDGVIFAIIVDDQLYFKVGDTNKSKYQQHGSRPFTYESRGKSISMSYWEVPADVMEDRDEIKRWAEESHQISRQGGTGKRLSLRDDGKRRDGPDTPHDSKCTGRDTSSGVLMKQTNN